MSLNEQVAQIIQIITKLQKQEDFHTSKNIVADKTIYAKKGLHVGDFNPAFDLFIKGNSCIKGDLIIKGNLIYENSGSITKSEFCDVVASEISGFRIRSDTSTQGFMWNESKGEFVIADERYFNESDSRYLKNVRMSDIQCRNVALESISSSSPAPIKIMADTSIQGNLSISQNLSVSSITAEDSVYFKKPIIADIAKIDKSLYVDGTAEIKELYTDAHQTKKLNILENVGVDGDAVINGNIYVKCGADIRKTLEVGEDLIIGRSLIFNSGSGASSGIAFSEITPIENGSVSFINGKRIPEIGDVLTTEENQPLWNKSLGNELDANLQRITNLNLPKENGDAVNKKYVDSFVSGCHFIPSARLCSISCSIDAVFANGSYISKKMEELVIDGVAPDIGDRVLLYNGLYNVISKGNRNQSWILQKTTDIINRDVLVLVRYGEKNARKIFCLSNNIEVWEFLTSDEYVKKAVDMDNVIKRLEKLEKLVSSLLTNSS
jgi:hypothetical protein